MLSAWEIRRSQDTQFGASGEKESPATMVSIIFGDFEFILLISQLDCETAKLPMKRITQVR